jgi:drug/metabolite transporter (DMT)-like permease
MSPVLEVQTTPSRVVGRPLGTLPAALAGAAGMVFVGGSVAVASVLAEAPMLTAQAVRYAVACLLLLAFLRFTGRSVPVPHGKEWAWLIGVTASGLVLFNIALVEGSRHAEPAVLGVAVASVPLALAVVGPLMERRRPAGRVLAAALVVTCGAALVQGVGRTDTTGLGWAALVLGCEAGFTLLAVPVLPSLGPWGVSVHATWIAALMFGCAGLVSEGPAAITRLGSGQLLGVAYLAVGVTAVAFVLWYSSVQRLGAGVAGLLTGVAPVAAAATGVLLGAPAPRPLVWVGILVVAAGLVLGLRTARPGGSAD